MPKHLRVVLVAIAIGVATVVPSGLFEVPALGEVAVLSASAQDTEGEPADPVVGRDRPVGESDDGTSYLLLTILALCLIGAGALLVKLDRWQRKRSSTDRTGRPRS